MRVNKTLPKSCSAAALFQGVGLSPSCGHLFGVVACLFVYLLVSFFICLFVYLLVCLFLSFFEYLLVCSFACFFLYLFFVFYVCLFVS